MGKRRKCWLPAFSPFPKMFPKASFLRERSFFKSLLSQGEIFFQKPPLSGRDLFSKASIFSGIDFFSKNPLFQGEIFFQKPPFSGRDLFHKPPFSGRFFFPPSKASFLRERYFFQKHPPQGEIFFISLLSQGDFFFFFKSFFSQGEIFFLPLMSYY